MDSQEKNLQSLLAEFHDKGKASRGYKNLIDNYISKDDIDGLEILLRFHDPIPVKGIELIQRFEIDALLDFYCLLLVAIFSGYVPPSLNVALRDEILLILNNAAVKKYYTTHYPYPMISNVLDYVKHTPKWTQEPNLDTVTAFTEFVSLNRSLKYDEEIERFMGMLDFVWYDGETINEVNRILSSYDALQEVFTLKETSEAGRSVRGFIKYSSFISQLKTLLEETHDYPMLQSAFWSFHGYYFDRFDTKMADFLDLAFSNLSKALSSPEIFSKIAEDLVGGDQEFEIDSTQLKGFAESVVLQAKDDVGIVLNKQWGAPLKDYLGELKSTKVSIQPDKVQYRWDVFLSYISADDQLADRLKYLLGRVGLSYWMATEQLTAGTQFSDAIVEGMRESRLLLLFVSDNDLGSDHITQHLRLVRQLERQAIVLDSYGHLAHHQAEILGNELDIQRVDLRLDRNDLDLQLERLVQQLKKELEKK